MICITSAAADLSDDELAAIAARAKLPQRFGTQFGTRQKRRAKGDTLHPVLETCIGTMA